VARRMVVVLYHTLFWGIGDFQMLLGECLGAGSPFNQNYLASCCIDIQ
jgi:hypothetical protein